MNIKNNVDESWCVYRHTNILNNKVYIGITCRKPKLRWGKSGCGYKSNPYFYNAIQKYGWDIGFNHDILYENLSLTQASEAEIVLISLYKSSQFAYGYNQDNGGNSKGKLTEATKIKIGKSNTGKRRTLVSRLLMSNVAQNMTDEHKQKMSDAAKGRVPWNKGKILSEHEKDAMKEKTYRKVKCVELNKVFKSISYAERELGLQASLICKVCNGERNKTGGYRWEYVD